MDFEVNKFQRHSLKIWLGAKLLSDVGSALSLIILGVYAYELTESPETLAWLLALRLIGTVVGGSCCSMLRRSFGNRVVMIAAEFVAAAAMVLLVLTPTVSHLILLYPVIFTKGLCQALFHVALYSEVPALVGHNKRHKLNAILSAIEGLGIVIGGVVASSLGGLFSFKVLFAADASSYLVSGAALLILRAWLPKVAEPEKDKAHLVAGLKAFMHLKPIFHATSVVLPLLILVRVFEAFGSSAHNVGFPILSTQFDVVNSAFLFSWIMAAWGAGRLVAAGIIPRLYSRLEKQSVELEYIFIVSVIVTFGFFIGVFWFAGLGFILAFALLAGIFDSGTESAYYSILQRAGRDERSLIVSLSYVLERCGMGVGMLAVGAIFASLGLLPGVLIFYGIGIFISIVVFVVIISNIAIPDMKSMDNRRSI